MHEQGYSSTASSKPSPLLRVVIRVGRDLSLLCLCGKTQASPKLLRHLMMMMMVGMDSGRGDEGKKLTVSAVWTIKSRAGPTTSGIVFICASLRASMNWTKLDQQTFRVAQNRSLVAIVLHYCAQYSTYNVSKLFHECVVKMWWWVVDPFRALLPRNKLYYLCHPSPVVTVERWNYNKYRFMPQPTTKCDSRGTSGDWQQKKRNKYPSHVIGNKDNIVMGAVHCTSSIGQSGRQVFKCA